LVTETRYGPAPVETCVAGHEARSYALGPVPRGRSAESRSPAVIAWCDGGMFYLLVSSSLDVGELATIAASCYRR